MLLHQHPYSVDIYYRNKIQFHYHQHPKLESRVSSLQLELSKDNNNQEYIVVENRRTILRHMFPLGIGKIYRL
jgi:hypothetical protein